MDGSESPISAMEWKKRYLHMEGKLKQFRIQATNIKLKLSRKMEELTIKCEHAEEKAEDAEYQLNVLRDSLAGVPGAAEQQERFRCQKMADLEEKYHELMERNSSLEKDLECERYMRKLDRDALHEKAVRIKEWVTRALNSAEKKNEELQSANDRLTAAVHAMQERLTELHELPSPLKGTQSSLKNHRSSKQNIPRSSAARESFSKVDQEVPSSPGSASPPPDKQWQRNPLFRKGSNESADGDAEVMSQRSSPAGMDTEYSEYEDPPASELSALDGSDYPSSKQSSRRSGHAGSKSRGKTSKSAGDTDVYSDSTRAELEEQKGGKKKSSTLPLTKDNVAPATPASQSTPSSSHTHHNFMGTFGSIRRRFKGLTENHPKHRSHEDSPSTPRGREKREKLRSKSKSPAPRSLSSPRARSPPVAIPSPPAKTNLARSPSHPVGTQEDESMLVDPSPSQTVKPSAFFSTSLPANSPSWKGLQASTRPPTPPSHGVPSWETRIYDMAKTGFRLPTNVFGKGSSNKNAPIVNAEYEPCDFADVVYKTRELTVPVYTKLKGKATQIRQSPFTDASDSSDDDRSNHHPPARQFSPRHQQRPSRSFATSGEVLPPSYSATQQRKNGSPGLARAIKRANSQQSMASSEGDYAIPPDAMFTWNSSVSPSDSSEPEHKLLKTCKHQSTTSTPRSGAAAPENDPGTLKCGYLTKLGGRVRTWRKRWFVLKNDALFYYNTANDVGQKPQGQIMLTGSDEVKVKREDDGPTLQISCGKRTYYLSADSSESARDWFQALLAVMEGSDASSLYASAPLATGWLTRTIGGSSCRVWTVIRNGILEFYEGEDIGEMPISRLSLSGCMIEAARFNLHAMSNTSHIRTHSPPSAPEHVILVRPTSERAARDVFLSFQTERQKSTWLQALTSAARMSCASSTNSLKPRSSSDFSAETEFERLVSKLVQSSSKSSRSVAQDVCSSIWRNPVLSFAKQGIARPLTTLCSEAMYTEAMKISKSIHAFANLSLDAASVDYHVTLSQGIAQSCLMHVELRDELYGQLIKLTNRRDTEISNSSDSSYLQSWMLMSLIIPLFLPRDKLLFVLRSHLKRHAKSKTEVGQYVMYCQRSLERILAVGERSAVPSRTEAISILLHNPHRHSLPFSLPVHFADGSYQVVGFDGSSTVNEFSHRVAVQSNIRHSTTSGFALYVNDPFVNVVTSEHYVEPTAKICDVISTWESHARSVAVTSKGLSPQTPHDGGTEQGRPSLRFSFKRRLDFKAYRRLETGTEKIMLVYQIAHDMSNDRFPLARELAVELAALAAQLHCGDKSRDPTSGDEFNHVIKLFVPARYREGGSRHQQKQTRERVSDRWAALRGTSAADAARIFLNTARMWSLCGAAMFLAKNETNGKHKGDTVWLAVTEDGLNVLHHKSMEVTDKCQFTDIVTFGGCKENFMVVTEMAGVSRKLFFGMYKVQMLELVRLIADYMNASPSFTGKLKSPPVTSS